MNALPLSRSKADLPACPTGPRRSHDQARLHDAFVLETNPLLCSSQRTENEANVSHDAENVNIELNFSSLRSGGEIRTIVICNTSRELALPG